MASLDEAHSALEQARAELAKAEVEAKNAEAEALKDPKVALKVAMDALDRAEQSEKLAPNDHRREVEALKAAVRAIVARLEPKVEKASKDSVKENE